MNATAHLITKTILKMQFISDKKKTKNRTSGMYCVPFSYCEVRGYSAGVEVIRGWGLTLM